MPYEFNEIPVSEHLEETVNTSLRILKKEHRKAIHKKILMGCASVCTAFAAAAIFYVANPSLAAKLPFIGGIFSDLEDDFTYPGDYSDRAQILTSPESSADTDTSAETAGGFTAADQGVIITASEIYSDGISVYLSLNIHSDTPVGYRYDDSGNQSPARLYLIGDSIFDGWSDPSGEIGDTPLYVEQMDENNLNGMLKFDLPSPSLENGSSHQLEISITSFGADYTNPDGTPVSVYENPGETPLWIRGNWELSLPFTVDTSRLQTFEELNPDDSSGYICDIYISPYQVAVHHVPVSDEYGNPISDVYAFDQNGNKLEDGNITSPFGYDFFSLQKTQPSEIRFYVIQDSVKAHKIQTEAEAAAEAVSTCTINPVWN